MLVNVGFDSGLHRKAARPQRHPEKSREAEDQESRNANFETAPNC